MDYGAKVLTMVRCDQAKCMYCGGCVAVCQQEAISVYVDRVQVDKDRCTDCGNCVTVCPTGALFKT